MTQSVFFEMKFLLLVLFSFVVPIGAYGFIYERILVSRRSLLWFGVILILISGLDVVLLQSLAQEAKTTASLLDDKIFDAGLSFGLYFFPAVYAGLGVSLLSHVLIQHMNGSLEPFETSHPNPGARRTNNEPQWLHHFEAPDNQLQRRTLVACAACTAIIFAFDLYTGSEIRLHVLYIFPLAMVARRCTRLGTTITAFFVVTTLQIITFATQAEHIPAFITDVLVALCASLLIVTLARTSRSKYLAAVHEAATDPLTGLLNRRTFVAHVELEIARQKRYGGNFSLAVLDLDKFKALNDSKGHAAGDGALILAADIIRNFTRESDSLARIGGDEFAVLLLNTQDVNCDLKFQTLCSTLAQHMIAEGYDITASIGCKTFAVPPDSTSHALKQADELMYVAKSRGKNCAVHSRLQGDIVSMECSTAA